MSLFDDADFEREPPKSVLAPRPRRQVGRNGAESDGRRRAHPDDGGISPEFGSGGIERQSPIGAGRFSEPDVSPRRSPSADACPSTQSRPSISVRRELVSSAPPNGDAPSGDSHQSEAAVSLVPRLVTINCAAKLLGVGRTTLYEQIAAGDLEVVHIGRATRVPLSSLDAFVARLQRQTTDAASAAVRRRAHRPQAG